MLGPADNQAQGVVTENRHLEYLGPNYAINQDQSEAQVKEEMAANAPPKTGNDTRSDEKS